MAKVTDKHDSWAMGKRLDCGHVFFDFDTEEDTFSDVHSDPFQMGDEVDCLVCADNEKRVKAARVEGHQEMIEAMNKAGIPPVKQAFVVNKLIEATK